MTEIRLSEKQREVVDAGDGAMLVLASAGSGKTRVLTERVRHLLTARPGTFKVLALTFTNKAADEMQSRLKIVPAAKDRTFIGTIHKFCLEIIRSKGATIGISDMPHIFERENDRMEILIEAFNSNPVLKEQLDSLDGKAQKKYLYDVLSYISQKKKYLLGVSNTDKTISEDEEELLVFNEYNSLLSSQNAIDFDDVICLAYKIIVDRPKVAELYRRMYKYLCIDEAQDLNFAQYEFIKALCGDENRNVLMVGDPNQAIYGFNGSDKIYMTKTFVRDFNAKTIRLTENYRSSNLVLQAANRLIPDSVDFSNAVIKGEFEIKECESEVQEAEWIGEKIEKFLRIQKHVDIEGLISPESIAVLARNKYVFNTLEQVLRNRNIPFFYKKTNDLSDFESDLIRIYDLGMRVLVNPIDKLHFQQLCKILKIGNISDISSTSGLAKLESLSNLISDDELVEDFKIVVEAWKLIHGNINAFLKALELLENYVSSSDSYSKNTDRKLFVVQDINELRDLWKQYSLQSHTDSKTLANFRNQIALGIAPSKGPNNSGVTLGTVHSVKGLEFDIVFLMGMNEGTFPDYRAVREGNVALNEEKNNAFVALTRAKRLLYLTFPKQKFMPWDQETPARQSPSRFIKAIQQNAGS